MKTFKTKENYLNFPTEKDGVVDGKIIARFQDPSFNSKLTGAIIQLEYFIEFEDLTLKTYQENLQALLLNIIKY